MRELCQLQRLYRSSDVCFDILTNFTRLEELPHYLHFLNCVERSSSYRFNSLIKYTSKANCSLRTFRRMWLRCKVKNRYTALCTVPFRAINI